MISNNFLFASQFLNYLASLKVADEDQYNAFKNTIHNFFKEDSTNSDSFITLAISLLGFTPETPQIYSNSQDSKYYLLHQGAPINKYPVVSCLYYIPENIDLNSCYKGFYPAFELISLLKNNNIEWGILTNGKMWRLYSNLSALPYENFIEINFENAEDLDYKVFWQLFTVHLFIPDENEITPLENYIKESEKESQLIEKHIKANIDEILENMTMGFLKYSYKLDKELSEKEKQQYFDNSVYLLFRLIFVLYAESRGLLPVNNTEYYKISLENLLLKAKEWIDNGIPDTNSTELWDSFRDLCNDIDLGNFEAKIPEYDGGLFAIDEHKFLNDSQNKISEFFFSKILTLLGYYKKGKKEIKIEYKDLSVRSIGSLYEGILEYKLFLAEEDLFIRGDKIIPARNAGNQKKSDRLVIKGSVYFSQDANERHDTGSYYTPEDVVNYMVQNSVRIALEDRWLKFLPLVQKYEKELNQVAKDSYRISILNKFDNELLTFVEEQILDFKAIDPTMGSGHFLVNSLNTITNFIIEVLQTAVKINSGQIKHSTEVLDVNWKLFNHKNDSINLDPSFWRRKVVERCIYGIDINPLATELAKLSLWIASSSYGKPLAFINHHIKCGDAIIGAKLEDIFKYPKSEEINSKTLKLFEKIKQDKISDLKKLYINLFHFDSDLMENIRLKKGIYDEIESNPFLNRLKDVSTLWLMISYVINGNKSFSFMNGLNLIDEDKYYQILDSIDKVKSNEEWINTIGDETYKEINKCRVKHKIFHWDLEFPEIINEGFDVAIGNPPYVDIDITNYSGLYYLPLSSNNLYVYALSKSISYQKDSDFISFIVPMSIISSKRMNTLRTYLFKNSGSYYFTNIDSTSHPGTLFSNVNIQITIVFSKKYNSKLEIYSTNYYRFYSYERKRLFKRIVYLPIKKEFMLEGIIPKISYSIEESIHYKLFSKQSNVIECFSDVQTDNYLYYRNTGNPYYRLTFDSPPFFEVNGNKEIPSTNSKIFLKPESPKYLILCLLPSSIFYWFWIVYSDCFHLTINDLSRFPINPYDFLDSEFENIYKEINNSLTSNGKIVTYNKKRGITKYLELKPRFTKHLFDKVDVKLSKYYGFTEEELNYILNYDLKYRTD